MEKIKVLSLFDGMSCGQLALQRSGIIVEKYYASEIDKYSISIAQKNFHETIQLGDVTKLKAEKLEKIDLLMGGSPCQNFSFAGKQKGMVTPTNEEILTLDKYLKFKEENFKFDGQSYLFWEYVRLLREIKPKYFLLENVLMSEKWQQVITKALGVKPIEINSSLVSGQNRRRLYWTNIQNVTEPIDKNILLKDILLANVPKDLNHTEKALKYMNRKMKSGGTRWGFGYIQSLDRNKGQCLTANIYIKASHIMFWLIVNQNWARKRQTQRLLENCTQLNAKDYKPCLIITRKASVILNATKCWVMVGPSM